MAQLMTHHDCAHTCFVFVVFPEQECTLSMILDCQTMGWRIKNMNTVWQQLHISAFTGTRWHN
jgi:hypothetical protein